MRLCWPTAWYNKQRLVDEVNRLNARLESVVAQRSLVDATLIRVETERLALEARVRDEQNEGDQDWFKVKQERDEARSAVDLGVALLLAADAPTAARELDKRRTWLETEGQQKRIDSKVDPSPRSPYTGDPPPGPPPD